MRVAALKITPEGIFRYRTEHQLAGCDYDVVNPSGKWVEKAADDPPDVIHVSYSGSPELLAELCALRQLRRVPFIADCDDLFTKVPEYNQSGNSVHPASPAYRMRVAMLKTADAVTVSTPTLAAMLKEGLGVDSTVVPNFVRAEDFDVPVRPKPGDQVRVLITSASGGHWGDLEIIRPAVIDCAQKYPQAQFCIFGTFPEWALPYPNLHNIRWTPVNTYFGMLRHLNPDIGLAPLLPNDFNRCKSGIKYYEYAMAGAAGIYADLDPYSEVRPGVTGLVVPPDPDAWRDALGRLIENAALRGIIRDNARADVLAHHTGPSALKPVIASLCGNMAAVEG